MACALVIMSLFLVNGAPGASQGTLQHSPSCRGEPLDIHYQTFRRQTLPRLSDHPTSVEVNTVWKDNKKKGDAYVVTTRNLLEDAASGKVRLDAIRRSLRGNRAKLQELHAQMLGWQTFYRTNIGHEFDPERRRLHSTHLRVTLARMWHDETDSLLEGSSQRWQMVQASIPSRLASVQSAFQKASNGKKAAYRTKYSAFVDHLLHGGHSQDIPFVSSREAKKRQASRTSSEGQTSKSADGES